MINTHKNPEEPHNSQIFCTNCGKMLAESNHPFCHHCGVQFVEERTIPADRAFILAALYGKNSWTRWIICSVSVVIMWQLVGALPLAAVCGFISRFGLWGFNCAIDSLNIRGSSHVPGFVLTMMSPLIGAVSLWFLSALIHKKKLLPIITGRLRFDYERFAFAMLIVFVLSTISLIVELKLNTAEAMGGELTRNPVTFDYVILAIFVVILVPIQAGMEEVFFRGYLLQGLSLVSRSKKFLLISTSLIFAAVHLANPEPWEYGILPYMAAILSLGAFMGIITLVDGGLELAIGFHTMNNIWSFLVVGLENSVMPTPSLYVLKIESLEIGAALIPGIFQFVILLGIFGWRYGWFRRRNQPYRS